MNFVTELLYIPKCAWGWSLSDSSGNWTYSWDIANLSFWSALDKPGHAWLHVTEKPELIYYFHGYPTTFKNLTSCLNELTNNDSNDLNKKGSPKDASDVITELGAHIQTLEIEVYFLREELKKKSFLLRSLISDKQNANICFKLPATPGKPMSSSPINKKEILPSNKNIDFHTGNGLKKEHILEVNKIKKVFFTTDNNHIKDNKPEKQAIYANNDSSRTTTESKNNKNNNSNNNYVPPNTVP